MNRSSLKNYGPVFLLYILCGINHPSRTYYGEKLLFFPKKKIWHLCTTRKPFFFFYEDKLWICREDGNDGILSGSSLILCDETCQ
jgi:hypothetical protein